MNKNKIIIALTTLLVTFWLMFYIPMHYFQIGTLYIYVTYGDIMVYSMIAGILGILFTLAYLLSVSHDIDLPLLYLFSPMIICTLAVELFWYFY